MKVYLRDKRRNPHVIYIDGKRYVLPTNKEIVKDISRSAFNNLSAMACISVREYIETNVNSSLEPVPDKQHVKEEKVIEVSKKEEPVVDVSGLVVEDKLEDSTLVSSISENVESEESPKKESYIEEALSEEIKSDDASRQDYSSLSKKELKALVEEKGGDPSGMTKSNLVDWLNSNA